MSLGVLVVTTHVAICAWVDILDECCGPVVWSRVVLPQDLQVVCWGMSDASVGDVAVREGSLQTIFSRSSGVVEMLATWTIILILE